MSYIRREIFTKDKEIQKYLDRLMAKGYVELPPTMSFEISRFKTIQKLRNINRKDPPILIAKDERAKTSIIKTRYTLTIKKIGDKYYFDL